MIYVAVVIGVVCFIYLFPLRAFSTKISDCKRKYNKGLRWYELNVHKIIRLSASVHIVYRCSILSENIPEYRHLYFTTWRNV
jgi:hypothetical protein